MSQQSPRFSPLQQQVLKAMAIPLWQPREQPAAVVALPTLNAADTPLTLNGADAPLTLNGADAPLTLIGGDAALRQSRFYAAMLQLLALDPASIAEAATPPAAGRCWLLVADCPAPRLDGEWLITPPLPQLQHAQHKRRLWQLVQQWL